LSSSSDHLIVWRKPLSKIFFRWIRFTDDTTDLFYIHYQKQKKDHALGRDGLILPQRMRRR
jgi:hypothetical protein